MDDKIEVEKVCDHVRNGNLPTLVKFQNGSLSGISEDVADYCIVENGKDKRKRALVASGQNCYIGDIQESTECDTYICVRNKITNKMTIVPVQQALLSNTVYEEMKKKQQKPMLNQEHATKKLLKEFGGRKASRFMANRDEMMVNVEVLRQELDETVKESTRNDDEEEDETLPDVNVNNEAYLANIVPKFDKNAKTVKEVYDIGDVVPQTLLDRLDEEAKVVYATPLDKLPIESTYLRACIKKIQGKEIAAKQDFLKIKLIIYMDALQSLIALRKRQMKTVELSKITEKIENDIRHRFADPKMLKSCTRTEFSTEKALTHFIVLALLISDKFEVDINELSRTLRTSRQRLVNYAHIVNAKPRSRSDMLSLRLPSSVGPLSTSHRRFQRNK